MDSRSLIQYGVDKMKSESIIICATSVAFVYVEIHAAGHAAGVCLLQLLVSKR